MGLAKSILFSLRIAGISILVIGSALGQANFSLDSRSSVQAVNDPDAGVFIRKPALYSDPGRNLTKLRFTLSAEDRSVTKVFLNATVVSPTGEVRSGETWPLNGAGGVRSGNYEEVLRGEVMPGDHVVVNVGRFIKDGKAFELPTITQEDFAMLPSVSISDRSGSDATAIPNFVCDYAFCDYCNNLATNQCKKGIHSFSCTIHPSCSCSFTCN